MQRISLPTMMAFVRTLEGQTLETRVQHKQFTVAMHQGVLTVTPQSTGKPRPITGEQLDQFLDLFAERGSFQARDYQRETRNASYLLAILEKHLRR